jgi:hypothetical protein
VSYRVQNRNGKPRLVWEWYEGNKRSQRHVPKREWKALGFDETVDLETAKLKTKQLNQEAWLQKLEAKRNKIEQRLKEEDAIECVYLPEIVVNKFENKISRKQNMMSHWRSAKRAIRFVKLHGWEFRRYPEKFYDYWRSESTSPSYVKKMIRILNDWGQFVSDEMNHEFSKMKGPSGADLTPIAKAYYKLRPRGNESYPVSYDQLKEAKDKLRIDNYNWIYLTIWLGLRPEEVDYLKQEYHMVTQGEVTAIDVFQPKLINQPEHKQWKLIPLLYLEQRIALQIIEAGNYKRPLVKTMERVFGDGFKLYAGRKGFEHQMIEVKGHEIETVAAWMGHQKIQTLWDKYRNRRKIRIK